MKKILYLSFALVFANINGMNSSYEDAKRLHEAQVKVNRAKARVSEAYDSQLKADAMSQLMDANTIFFEAQTQHKHNRQQATNKTLTPELPWCRAQPIPTASETQRSQSQPLPKKYEAQWSRSQLLTQPKAPIINNEINDAAQSVHNIVESFCKSGISRELGQRKLQDLWYPQSLPTQALLLGHLTKHVSQEQAQDLMNGVDNPVATETLLTAIDPAMGSFAQSFNKK